MGVKLKCSNVIINNLEYIFKNQNTMYPNLQNRCKAAFKGKCIVVNAVTKKKGKIDKWSIHFKTLSWKKRNDILKDKNNTKEKKPKQTKKQTKKTTT